MISDFVDFLIDSGIAHLTLACHHSWLLDFAHINIGFFSQLGHYLDLGAKFTQTFLIALHDLCELTIHIILGLHWVKVRIVHPFLFEWFAAHGGCLRSLRH